MSRISLPAAVRAIRLRDLRIAVVVGAAQIGWTLAAAQHPGAGSSRCWWASRCQAPTHLNVLGVALLVAAAAALALRRLAPRAVLAWVFGVTLAYAAIGYQQGPNYASLAVALISVVICGDRVAAAVTLAAGWVGFLWLPDALGHAGPPNALAAVAIAAWLLVLLAGAEALRGRRSRAVEARRSREVEARRRASEERLEIARELHDVLAHSISVINVQSGVALHLIDERPEQARTALTAINEASAEALREVRSVLGVLRGTGSAAPREPTAGLARLDELVANAGAAGVEVSVEVRGQRRALPASVDLAAFRIAQESLTNIVRHAGAAAAEVRLSYGPQALAIEIEDGGRGERVPAGIGIKADTGSGNGIAGMRERATALGGSLEAGPVADGGFRVRAVLPVEGALR